MRARDVFPYGSPVSSLVDVETMRRIGNLPLNGKVGLSGRVRCPVRGCRRAIRCRAGWTRHVSLFHPVLWAELPRLGLIPASRVPRRFRLRAGLAMRPLGGRPVSLTQIRRHQRTEGTE